MARQLTERYVQAKAIGWLEAQLRGRDGIVAVASKPEAVLKRDRSLPGHGRADGLIAGRRQDGATYTISLEAKSRRTLHNLRTWLSGAGLAIVLTAGLVAAGAAFAVWQWANLGWLGWLAAPMTFLAVAFALIVLVEAVLPHALWDADVVRQVLRYPGHERWIAISTGALRSLGSHETTLRARCRKEGIGLLVVNHRGTVRVVEVALRPPPGGDLEDNLICYCDDEALRAELERRTITDGFPVD